MYEYEIYNKELDEIDFIYGYSVKDAFRRSSQHNPSDWKVIHTEYID